MKKKTPCRNEALQFLTHKINIIHKVLVTKRKPIRVLCASKCPAVLTAGTEIKKKWTRNRMNKMRYNHERCISAYPQICSQRVINWFVVRDHWQICVVFLSVFFFCVFVPNCCYDFFSCAISLSETNCFFFSCFCPHFLKTEAGQTK